MHILLIHQVFATIDEPGGTRHYEFARVLAVQGHQVTVVTSPVSYLSGEKISLSDPLPFSQKTGGEGTGQVVILHARTFRALHKSFIHRLLFFVSFMASSFWIGLGVKNVDLVWGTSPPIFQGLTAWLLARLKRLPFLFEVRDLWPAFPIAAGALKNPILIKLSLWLEHFLYRNSDRVMVNSPGFVDHVKERGARLVDLVPNSADPEMFDPANNGLLFRSANHLKDQFVVLYAGAHGLSNDLGVVLEAARMLQEERDGSKITIVLLGDGKEKPALQKQAAALRLTNLLFLPPVPKSGMAEALAGADACLAILKPIEEYKTTYPNKVFDYMAAGRPIILAIDGSIRQVVEAAQCGIFSRPGSPSDLARAVRNLSSDLQAARAMGLRGRKYLEEHFNRNITSGKLIEILVSMHAKEAS
jgi:glycosyltransferase involved in cell wall biosynthesis